MWPPQVAHVPASIAVAIEPLVQPELFTGYQSPSDAVAFFVACFSGNLNIRPESPVSIQIAVPDRYMRGWLFKERLDEFVKGFDQMPVGQHDLAVPKPKLKKNIGKQQDKDGTGS